MHVSSAVSSTLARLVAAAFLLGTATRGAFADAVTDWNTAYENALLVASERGPAVPSRPWAIMHAAMFDAVNGIVRKYEPLRVTAAPPLGANPEAAAIQAAYTALTASFPAHQAEWDAQLTASLATLPTGSGAAASITSGRAWGTTVANAIIAWRTGDIGTPPTFVGNTNVGFWKHPSNTATATAGYANLATAPFVLVNPAAFDPGAPYGYADRAAALASLQYAADVNESIARGGATSTVRTVAEEQQALFINACDQASMNRLLHSLLPSTAGLVDNARTFALFNISFFDTAVVLFRAKYAHQLWRPFQAINNADLDNNAATTKPATAWTSFRPTPPHPEYPSAHVTLFSAMLKVAARLVGDDRTVQLYAPGFVDPVAFPSLAAISDAAIEARVNIGYHFRETCEVSQILGRAVGDYIVNRALLPQPGSGLVNLSVRGRAGTNDETLIAGLVIGTGVRQVLIRGVGPTLQGFGVPTALTDPKVVVFDSAGTIVAQERD